MVSMTLPRPRGPFSSALFRALRQEGPFPKFAGAVEDDQQIALWALYELHYRGFADVGAEMEWNPEALTVRAGLESTFEHQLRSLAEPLSETVLDEPDLVTQLERISTAPGPSLAAYLHREADRSQFLEFLVLRSLYNLKEADPHTWVLPRLRGRAKAALAEIQYDEYGGGDPARIHQVMFARTLAAVGLDPAYGAGIDQIPAHTLAISNAMSLFGLHRRLRGAAMGHLAALEMTSSIPARRVAQGTERLGLGAEVAAYFDEHVEADAVHEQIASRDLCGALVADEPDLREDVLFGASVCVLLEAVAAESVLTAWSQDRSALRTDTTSAQAS